MKTLLMILLPFTLLGGCGQNTKDKVAGTYINQSQSAYSVASDTLLIKPDAMTENTYQVIRKTGFRSLPDGKNEFMERSFTGVWDAQKQTVTLSPNGLVLVIGRNELRAGSTQYRKL